MENIFQRQSFYISSFVYFISKNSVLLNFYLVFLIQYRSWFLWSKIIPFTLNFWVCIRNIYIEGIEVGRERERRHGTQKNISSYNFQSNFKKTFLKFLKSCRVNHVFELFYPGTYMWKITFFNFKVITSFKLFRSILPLVQLFYCLINTDLNYFAD